MRMQTIYAMGWCNRPGDRFKFRMAVGSFMEEYANKIQVRAFLEHFLTCSSNITAHWIYCVDYSFIQIVRRTPTPEGRFSVLSELDHPYPATKVMWAPPSHTGAKDLIV